MKVMRKRRGVALALASCMFLGLVVAGAAATNSLKQAEAQRQHLEHRVVALRHRRHRVRARFHRRIHSARRHVSRAILKANKAEGTNARTFAQVTARPDMVRWRKKVLGLQHRRKRILLAIHAQVMALKAQRDALSNWIDTNGIFKYCPVDGPNTLANNFGIVVRLPGVPMHIHQGDDISAATGTPIVAPFDGDGGGDPQRPGGAGR